MTMTNATLTRRAFIRRASGLVLATAGGLVAAGAGARGVEAAGLCPVCRVAPRGPLHAHLYATSPAPTWADHVIGRESRWQSDAVNASSGAAGLCQFMPYIWGWLTEIGMAYGSPYDPIAAIDAQSACLREGWYWMWSETAPW
jgi:hypothetical protein